MRPSSHSVVGVPADPRSGVDGEPDADMPAAAERAAFEKRGTMGIGRSFAAEFPSRAAERDRATLSTVASESTLTITSRAPRPVNAVNEIRIQSPSIVLRRRWARGRRTGRPRPRRDGRALGLRGAPAPGAVVERRRRTGQLNYRPVPAVGCRAGVVRFKDAPFRPARPAVPERSK
ncbi:hypothetical protein Arub01_40340 [Actinomadura rubrobrunea]|uniref:Uncharacterized protein n=1 Tax=Actinomadura rubrobrunea TaxID=115335 RepID=A0A9W6PXF3_9ACTN|nr:hypothetical protein [Actinomadura rubrobrunea]GLW65790.1 hypothetical protein Arub01_40340 [Actinomadura rubrobrunea]